MGGITNEPPRSYFLVYLWATAPLGIWILAMAAPALAAWSKRSAIVRFLRRQTRKSEDGATVALPTMPLLVLAWLCAPLVVSFSPVRQDGVRYILPSLLALNIVAACGVEALWSLVRQARWARAASWAAACTFVAYLAVTCWRIHPYYLDYYGEQVGGVKSVAAGKKFEVAWWGEGMGEALEYLNREAPQNARVYKGSGCFQPAHLAWMRGDLWMSEARRPQEAQWFLVYQPHLARCPLPADAGIVYEVVAQGAVLARVYRRDLP
jgi:hypothetical protein